MQIKWKNSTQEKMNVVTREGVTYLTYPAFDAYPKFVHGFSTRFGGVSEGIYSSMNLSFSRGDREENVRENYRRLARAMDFDMMDIVTSDQTHTTNVRIITEADRGNGITRPRPYTDVDGMITNVPGLVLATFYADCVPLYFLDPEHLCIGLSHSGWRGTVGKIGAGTIQKLSETYGSRPDQLLAAIGPSICQSCYEVGEEVILQFQEAFDRKLWPSIFYQKENGKYQLDLWRANYEILLEAGVLPEHISLPNLCTCCNPELLFSHRASQGKRGNLGAFLGIRKA